MYLPAMEILNRWGDLFSKWLIVSKIIAFKLSLDEEGARIFLSKKKQHILISRKRFIPFQTNMN